MYQLGLDDVKEMLGDVRLPGNHQELEVLVHWIQRLVHTEGEDYVRRHRKKLCRDWACMLEFGLSNI
jgi:hypothetical protein